MMGTDHPFELADFTPVQTVEALELDEAATRAILWDNAASLLGLPVDASARS
jgi:predicted TIM-barrel fold metal-dependent hydrolase